MKPNLHTKQVNLRKFTISRECAGSNSQISRRNSMLFKEWKKLKKVAVISVNFGNLGNSTGN